MNKIRFFQVFINRIEYEEIIKGGKMLEKYFEYKKHKTNFKTEVIAGVTTFLTMAYIMFLNPFILSGEFAGPEKGFFDFGAVFTATIVATALACFIMAFY